MNFLISLGKHAVFNTGLYYGYSWIMRDENPKAAAIYSAANTVISPLVTIGVATGIILYGNEKMKSDIARLTVAASMAAGIFGGKKLLSGVVIPSPQNKY